MAKQQNISVLGINDFNTTEGYTEFAAACQQHHIYPLFNIEFASLDQQDKEKGYYWNDPVNPGVVYLCGKGLNNPPEFSKDSKNLVSAMWKRTQDRIWKMLDLLNEQIKKRKVELSLDYNQIRNQHAKNTVREYHIAKKLYFSIIQKWPIPAHQIDIFRQIFDDPSFEADPADKIFLQDQIHKRLLDTGKPAWVGENYKSFLSTQQVRTLILEAGGIPSYPVYTYPLNDPSDCDKNLSVLAHKLQELEIFAVEFIPNNTSIELLKKYALFFNRQNFCVTFGTGHNTSGPSTMIPSAQDNVPFDSELHQIAYQGACIIAAHQEMRRANRPGFINDEGKLNFSANQLKEFIRIGDEAIRKITSGAALKF